MSTNYKLEGVFFLNWFIKLPSEVRLQVEEGFNVMMLSELSMELFTEKESQEGNELLAAS
jgi:hypothetical protein